MYPRWACLLYLLLLSSVLLTAYAAPRPGAKTSTSIPKSSDGILQLQQNSLPDTPISIVPLQNTTLSAPNPTPADPIVPIPGTDAYLRITYIGETSFETSHLETLISGACAKIKDAVNSQPDDHVAPLPWFYQSYSKRWRETIAIRVRGNDGMVVTWRQLHWVLTSLLHFMEGEPMHLHPVNFDVVVVRTGTVAAGMLWHSQSPDSRGVERGKRGLSLWAWGEG